jgi:hypothetical protein
MNPTALGLALAIGPAVLAPAPVLAPTVAPAVVAGFTISATGKEKKKEQ